MCLAVPGKILSMSADARATVDMLGAQREISLRLTPTAQIDDYVLVHAGFAIQVIDAQEAAETLQLVDDLAELTADELGLDAGGGADGGAATGADASAFDGAAPAVTAPAAAPAVAAAASPERA